MRFAASFMELPVLIRSRTRGETLALTARIAQLEQSHQEANSGTAAEAREAYQAAAVLRGEIAELKTAMLEQQRTQPNDGLVRSMEEMRRGQIQDLQDQIAQNQRGTLEWENRFKELRGDIQTLMQRQIQAESVAKQAYALVTQETAQIRGGLKADLAAIEAQLNERRARDAALQGMEGTLNLRLRELHSQLAQGSLAQDHRDGELRDLKNQVQLLAQQLGQIGLAASPAPLSRHDPATASPAVAASSDIMPGLQPAELRPAAAVGGVDTMPNLFQPVAPVNGHTPDQSKISAMDLHDRLSAEIERKRAELREKSGRWKVRQQ
jgi:hypothetical protein